MRLRTQLAAVWEKGKNLTIQKPWACCGGILPTMRPVHYVLISDDATSVSSTTTPIQMWLGPFFPPLKFLYSLRGFYTVESTGLRATVYRSVMPTGPLQLGPSPVSCDTKKKSGKLDFDLLWTWKTVYLVGFFFYTHSEGPNLRVCLVMDDEKLPLIATDY